MHSDRLPLPGLPNTRDLGGFPVRGGAIARDRLIRSGMLAPASAEALDALVSVHRLRAVIDFRTAAEQREHPDPALPGVEWIPNPIIRALTSGITKEERGQTPLGELILNLKQQGIDAKRFMSGLYAEMVNDEFSQRQYARFFELLSVSRDGAVLWHCTAGKDRVGLGTAMLLLALDAKKSDVIEDYLATRDFYRDSIENQAKAAAESLGDAAAFDTVRALYGVEPEYIQTAFSAMETVSGSMDAFMTERVGLTPERRRLLKTLYVI